MATLVLDTALHCAQAALFDGERCLAHKLHISERGHAEILLPLLDEVFSDAKLDWKDLARVVVTIGPGVFTGIRIGIAVARALRLVLGIPVIGVSTLQALAAAAPAKRDKTILALIDAHKDEAYAQFFSPEQAVQSEPMLLKASALSQYIRRAGQMIVYPPAFLKSHPELGGAQIVERLDPALILKCASITKLEPLPLYVRAPDASPQPGALLRRA